jgi:hypothetical protein
MDCINYYPSSYDLIILPYHILFTLCVSTDKTRLILVSIIRLFILLIIFNYLEKYEVIQFNQTKPPQNVFYCILAFYIFLNIIYIIIALFKKPTISKEQNDQIINDLAEQLQEHKLSETITQ